jgi:hypothetical protein
MHVRAILSSMYEVNRYIICIVIIKRISYTYIFIKILVVYMKEILLNEYPILLSLCISLLAGHL